MNKNGNLSRKTFVQSVERALDILELVEKSQRPMRSGEIAKALGLSPATASNLIRTLYMRNYLEHNKDNTYTLGVQNFILGSSADTWKTLRNVSDSILQALSRESEAASFLGVLYQRRMLAINMVIPTSPISIAVNQDWQDQCHATASGKILLSALEDEELDDFLRSKPLRQLTGRTVCDPEMLKNELRTIRAEGYSVVQDESVFGISSIGVPVCGRDWRPIAALAISFSSYFLNDAYLQRQLILLNKYRRELEKSLVRR